MVYQKHSKGDKISIFQNNIKGIKLYLYNETNKELSVRFKVSEPSLKNWQSEKKDSFPSDSSLRKICDATGIELEELLYKKLTVQDFEELKSNNKSNLLDCKTKILEDNRFTESEKIEKLTKKVEKMYYMLLQINNKIELLKPTK